MSTVAVIAQLVNETPLLYTYGPMGIVLAWFMWRGEKIVTEIRSLAHRIDGLTKALLVDMVERETCGLHVKRYAKEEIAKIDARIGGGSQ